MQNSNDSVQSRRQWLQVGACATGGMLATGMVPREAAAAQVAKSPHFAARAKRVIFIFVNGGPSQFESFDYKPMLRAKNGSTGKKKGKLLGPLLNFSQHGESGMWVSEAFPHLAGQVDQLCMLNAMQTSSRAHPLAIPLLHTGEFQFQRPSLGSWLLHGLGTENPDLPGFFTIKPTRTFGGPANYGNAFLPSTCQATRLGWEGRKLAGETLRNLTAANGWDGLTQQATLAATQQMNAGILQQTRDAQGVMDSLELGQRMQESVPEVLDLGRESPATLAQYGIDGGATDDFGRQCLLARRLSESGVRIVEIAHNGWDHHSNIDKLPDRARQIDQPIAALLADLRQRGLLEETLVVWTGEFGRTPETQILSGKEALGRDHNADGYTAWMAGGGTRRGHVHGRTDELGYAAVEGAVHLHDLHATMLHLLGLDHERLVYRYGGRDFRLTNIYGDVVSEIIA